MFANIIRCYTIAFTVRSGSNAICDLLARNGLGAPSEWFQKPPSAQNDQPWLDAFVRLINERQAEGTFGSKMMHDHRARLDERLRAAIPGYRCLDDLLPFHRWLWLVRKDKALQAISLCRAERSGSWAMTESANMAPGDYEYDFIHVLSRLLMIQGGDFAWEVYFQQHGIEPFVIVYEDFFQDLDRQLPKLIDYLGGLPPGRAAVDMGQSFRIQRDAVSYALRQRFISDLTRIGEDSFAQEMGEPIKRWERFFFDRRWRL
jgi:LPS sulfotransferase NodH